MFLSRALVIASLTWLLLLAIALVARIDNPHASVAGAVYAFCSLICHQRPDRSFYTAGVEWPVCGRCAGLYLSAPLGAGLAWWHAAPAAPARVNINRLLIAALPTALTVLVEVSGLAPVTSLERACAAVPLGAMIAFTLVSEAAEPRARIG